MLTSNIKKKILLMSFPSTLHFWQWIKISIYFQSEGEKRRSNMFYTCGPNEAMVVSGNVWPSTLARFRLPVDKNKHISFLRVKTRFILFLCYFIWNVLNYIKLTRFHSRRHLCATADFLSALFQVSVVLLQWWSSEVESSSSPVFNRYRGSLTWPWGHYGIDL